MGRPNAVDIPVGWVPKRTLAMPLPGDPHLPAPNDDDDRRAFQALNMGRASAEQQQRCLAWLAFASGYTAPAYVPGDAHATAHAEGRRWLMIQVDHMVRARDLKAADTEQGI